MSLSLPATHEVQQNDLIPERRGFCRLSLAETLERLLLEFSSLTQFTQDMGCFGAKCQPYPTLKTGRLWRHSLFQCNAPLLARDLVL